MLLLLTVLTVAEITRVTAVAAVVRCSPPSVLSPQGCRSAGLENVRITFDHMPDTDSPHVEFDTCFTKDHHPVPMHDATSDRISVYPAWARGTCRS